MSASATGQGVGWITWLLGALGRDHGCVTGLCGAVGWGGRRKGASGRGEVVTIVVSGLGSLSCEKDAPVGDRRCGCNSCCI